MNKLLLVILLLSISISTSQNGKMDVFNHNIKELANRPLLIVLKNGNSESTTQFNNFFKDAVESEWTVHQSFEVITEDEFKQHKKNKINKYAYLLPGKVKGRIGSNAQTIKDSYKALFYLTLQEKKEIKVTNIEFEFKNKDHKARYYETIQQLNKLVTPKENKNNVDIYSQEYLDNVVKEANIVLKEKTLLIDQDLIHKKVSLNTIKKYYPYNFKIVSKNEINEAIIANDTTKLKLSHKDIIDLDTGELLLQFSYPYSENIKSVKFSPYGIGSGMFKGKTIKEDDLKSLNTYIRE